MSETWFPFCNRRPGPDWKYGYGGVLRTRGLDLIEGEVKHSAEGNKQTMLDILDGMRSASWTCSVYKSGPPDQHYPLEYVQWLNGSPVANTRFTGSEHEGVAGEPLTENQVHWATEISKALRQLCPRVAAFPPTRRINLWEHNEMVRFGSEPTACPSGRIPWDEIIKRLTVTPPPPQEDDMFEKADRDMLARVHEWTMWQRNIAGLESRFVSHGGGVYLLSWDFDDPSEVKVRRHHIANQHTYALAGGNPDWSDAVVLTDAQAAKIPIGTPVQNLAP